MNEFENRTKQLSALKTWREAHLFFSEHFQNRVVTYRYRRDNRAQEVRIKFQVNHFQHLMGIKYQHGAKRFWKHVKIGNVDFKNVIVNNTNPQTNGPHPTSFQLKMNAIVDISTLIREKARIVDRGKVGSVEFDHLIRSNKKTTALATRKMNSKDEYFFSNLHLAPFNNPQLNGNQVVELFSHDLHHSDKREYFKI